MKTPNQLLYVLRKINNRMFRNSFKPLCICLVVLKPYFFCSDRIAITITGNVVGWWARTMSANQVSTLRNHSYILIGNQYKD